MALTKIDDRGLTTPIDLLDNEKIRFGTGNDLEIYHNANNSYIQDTGTGNLHLTSNGTAVSIDKGTSENMAVFNVDGAVELYYNGNKKFNTTSAGAQLTGSLAFMSESTNISLLDNGKAKFGNGDDLQIYHDGNNNLILGSPTVLIKNQANSESYIRCNENAEVSLYYDNSKKLETTSTGATITGKLLFDSANEQTIKLADNRHIHFGDSADLKIFHDGSHSYVEQTGTGSLYLKNSTNNDHVVSWSHVGGDFRAYVNNGESSIIGAANGSVNLYYDNVLRFYTHSGGAYCVGNLGASGELYLPDNGKLVCGGGDDLQIYHDGLHSYISDIGEGYLLIKGSEVQIQSTTGEDMAKFIPNGAVELYYDNSRKLHTKSDAVYITGCAEIVANKASDYAALIINDGNNVNRHGIKIQCGTDVASGTNYAITIQDGDGTTQGDITFSGGTVTYGTFTAYHPCIVPDSENPSDSSNAYPYGTLLETISIEYTQKNGSDTERGIRYKVQKTQSANSRKILGAYGGSMNGGPSGQTNEHQALVLGDGHILVNNAGGNIEVGDGICSSATAGIGQKATANPSMIIGIAQEAITFTGSETKLVAVQYGLQQFIPWT